MQKDRIKEQLASPVSRQQEAWLQAAFEKDCAGDGMTLLLVTFSFSSTHFVFVYDADGSRRFMKNFRKLFSLY